MAMKVRWIIINSRNKERKIKKKKKLNVKKIFYKKKKNYFLFAFRN